MEHVKNFNVLVEELQFTPQKSLPDVSETDVEVIGDEHEDPNVKYSYQRKNKFVGLYERLNGRLNDGSMELSKDLEEKVNEARKVINKSDVFNGTQFDKKSIFSCLFCSKFFKCTTLLNEHIAQAHSTKNKYRCSICGNSYKHKKNLVSHTEKHKQKQEYACKVCNMVFTTFSTMEAHSAREHSESGETASSVASNTNLKSLTRVDKTCKVCGQAFASRQSMIRHTGRKHPDEKNDASVTAVSHESVPYSIRTSQTYKKRQSEKRNLVRFDEREK